jgi:hypothetical protein
LDFGAWYSCYGPIPQSISLIGGNAGRYLIVFAGLVLTAFGSSSYYHLEPDNASLLWDRLPMVIVFMSLA